MLVKKFNRRIPIDEHETKHVVSGLAEPTQSCEDVLDLYGRDGMDFLGATDCVNTAFGQTKVFNTSFPNSEKKGFSFPYSKIDDLKSLLDKLSHSTNSDFNRSILIRSMLIEEINRLNPEFLE